MEKSILGLLGLAIRAKRARAGTTASESAIKSGEARLILLADDGADNTCRSFIRLSKSYNIPVLVQHKKHEYGACFHGAPRTVVVVTDDHFAAGMLSKAEGEKSRSNR